MSRKTFITFVLIVVFLTGCESKLSGRYEDDRGITTYEFNTDGTAVVMVLGATVAANYAIDGDSVLVTSPQGTIVLTRRHGDLYGPRGLKLTRTKRKGNSE